MVAGRVTGVPYGTSTRSWTNGTLVAGPPLMKVTFGEVRLPQLVQLLGASGGRTEQRLHMVIGEGRGHVWFGLSKPMPTVEPLVPVRRAADRRLKCHCPSDGFLICRPVWPFSPKAITWRFSGVGREGNWFGLTGGIPSRIVACNPLANCPIVPAWVFLKVYPFGAVSFMTVSLSGMVTIEKVY